MVILGLPSEALPHKPGFSPPQQQKHTKRKHFNHQSSNSTPSMTMKHQYYDRKPQPRKQNMKEMYYSHQEKEKKRLTVVYIRALDPDATESSSDEGELEAAVTKKKVRGQIFHVINIPSENNNDHASSSIINHEKSLPEFASKSPFLTERDDQACEEKRGRIGRKSNNVKIHEKKNNGRSSSLFTSAPVKATEFAVKKDLVLDCCTSCPSMGLCDVPGPIPDNLDSLMQDQSLASNFFEGLDCCTSCPSLGLCECARSNY